MTMLSSSVSFDELPPEIEVPPQTHFIDECQHPVMMHKSRSVKQDLHIKCLALSSLTGACLTALCYCSFASLNRLLISMHAFSLSRHSAHCDPAYVYIPAVFMLAFYLLYLFECYQSNTRYMLTHFQNEPQIQTQINRLRNSQPIIWWKALNYHYLRRTRLITRYRNGEAFTSTQVYFQRVNSRITSTCYVYETGGDLSRPNCVDISRKITDLDKYPLVKIKLSKGFAFSNVAKATEFECQRNAFFSANEHIDDFLEMREGLDLINCSFPEYLLCKSANAPWYISQAAFWAFSILLLSWPLRLVIQMNVAQMNYQIVKLFGANSTVTSTNANVTNDSSVPIVAPSLTLVPESNDNNLLSITTSTVVGTSFPPSYSEAMLWPPRYSSLVLPQNYGTGNINCNDNDNDNDNSLCRNHNFQACDQTNNYVTEQQSASSVTQNSSWNSCVHLLSNERTEDHFNKPNSNWPLRSSVSCSLLHGQLVYLVNPLPILLRNIGRTSIVERKQSNSSIDSSSLNRTTTIEQDVSPGLITLDGRRKGDLNYLINKLGHMKRSFTAQHVPQTMRQFSSQFLIRIKSMHNLRPIEESIL